MALLCKRLTLRG